MKDRKFKRVFLCLLAVLVVSVSSVSVFAKDFTEADGENLVESCKMYVETLYTYDDEMLKEMRDMGDFYLVTSDMVLNEREELGDFVKVNEGGTYEVQGDSIMVHIPTQFKNYTADIVLTFDSTGTEPKNFVINPDYTLGEKMFGAFQNFILGIIIVFVMLLFLAFIISLLKFLNPDLKKKRAAEKAAKAEITEAAPAETAAPAAAPAVPVAAADDTEMIVAMAAAIAAAEAEGSGGSYVVRSIRRAGSTRNWTRS